ncbi:hypothetical protein BU14_0617s0003 [Porphyra umbilicalis]|uniref:Uncharacterized protein n=1 Tax=Porphyra umbilicalis TaxID=2786 RepID=A0A1X6NQW9_PORUM|nr:hypothetical protein BU14_0617s0003 [Porphyra umbilicalis]|eukprot:OSX70998.1 hypothetical protein BU14_0617s0003 [Porphyra umbilicalis]
MVPPARGRWALILCSLTATVAMAAAAFGAGQTLTRRPSKLIRQEPEAELLVADHEDARPLSADHPGEVPRRLSDQRRWTGIRSSVKQSLGVDLKNQGLVPEALSGGQWKCGYSSGKVGSCFFTSAAFLAKAIGQCRSCAQNTNTGTPPFIHGQQFPTSPNIQCASCQDTIKKGPACGKLFGIGSKRSGRSCRLVKAPGCWPTTSDKVLHDCGAGAECKYKVTGAKAKIWCCRRKRGGFFGFAKNFARCGFRSLSKSKDRDGAVVMWE